MVTCQGGSTCHRYFLFLHSWYWRKGCYGYWVINPDWCTVFSSLFWCKSLHPQKLNISCQPTWLKTSYMRSVLHFQVFLHDDMPCIQGLITSVSQTGHTELLHNDTKHSSTSSSPMTVYLLMPETLTSLTMNSLFTEKRWRDLWNVTQNITWTLIPARPRRSSLTSGSLVKTIL